MGDELCSEVQFYILQTVSESPKSATEIAKITDLSLPHVLTQIKLLEAKGLLQLAPKEKTTRAGKPKKHYMIGTTISEIITIAPGKTVKFRVYAEATRLTKQSAIIGQVKNPKNQEALTKYYWDHINEFDHVQAMGFLSEGEHHVELIAITEDKHLDILRSQISKQSVKIGKHTTTMSCWVHTEEEFIYGILQEDEYYLKHMKRLTLLLDEHKIFKRLKDKLSTLEK